MLIFVGPISNLRCIQLPVIYDNDMLML